VFTPENEYWNLGLVKIIGSATAVNILSFVETKLGDFGMDKDRDVVSFITDGAAVMKKIGRISGVEHQYCIVHGIQLAVLDVLYKKKKNDKTSSENLNEEEVEDDSAVETGLCIEASGDPAVETVAMLNSEIYVSIEKLRKLSTFFKRSAYNNEKLQGFVQSLLHVTKEIPLKHDSPTRWSSMYSMLERYWEIRRPVDHALMVIKTGITLTDQDKYVYWCVLKTLGPVMITVKVQSCRSFVFVLFFMVD
jgi:hypothetical protein